MPHPNNICIDSPWREFADTIRIEIAAAQKRGDGHALSILAALQNLAAGGTGGDGNWRGRYQIITALISTHEKTIIDGKAPRADAFWWHLYALHRLRLKIQSLGHINAQLKKENDAGNNNERASQY